MAKAWNIQLRDDIGHKEDSLAPPGLDYETWLGPAPWIPFNKNRFHYKWYWRFGTGDAGNDELTRSTSRAGRSASAIQCESAAPGARFFSRTAHLESLWDG